MQKNKQKTFLKTKKDCENKCFKNLKIMKNNKKVKKLENQKILKCYK